MDTGKYFFPLLLTIFLLCYRSSVEKDYCIDSHFRGANERIGLELCTKDNPGARGEQNFALTWRKVRSGGNVLHLNQGHFNFYIEATDTCVLKNCLWAWF